MLKRIIAYSVKVCFSIHTPECAVRDFVLIHKSAHTHTHTQFAPFRLHT